MARSSSSSSSSSSGSPAAKRTAIAPKTQRASTSAAAAAASSSSKHNAVALASLADALPDQTANLPIAASSSSSNEPSLGDRINQSHANGKRLLNNNLQRKQQQQQRPLINGSASHPHDDDQDDEDAHHALAPSFSSKFPNGKLNGSTTRSTGAAGDPDLLTLLQQEGSNEAQHDNNDDLSPVPLPSSNPLSSSPALSHALTQALHSADTALLSSILSHSDPLLIRSTVQRLSGARALSLLEHCVSRLVANPTADARARGTATGKVRTNVEWIRAILVIHTSYLMALPHLTTKLASLHMALSSRLASHQRLLALQGRLDLVLSQIEMRSAYAAAAGVSEEKAGKRRKGSAIQGVSSKLAGANAAAATAAAVAGQKKGSKRQLGEDDPTRWVEPSDDEDDEQNDENLQPTPNNTMDVDVDPSSDDDEEEDSDEDDNDEDDEEEEEQYEELSPVDPASELEDDSDIEDIMLGPGFSSSASPRANGTAKSRRRRILEDSEDGGDTTADSGPDDDDDGDADDDDLQYGGLASAMRARGMAQRLAEAAKQTSALNTGGASASGSVKGPGSEDLVAVKGRRGKRGAGAVAEQAPARNGKATASGAKASKMDLDDDDDDEEDDESLLDEEGNSDLEDDDEEDDDDHADYGMADMEAESTDGDGEEDGDDEEEED